MTKEELLIILRKDRLEDTEILQTIQYYLQERKGVQVQLQRPTTMTQLALMNHAYNSVLNYYSSEL